MSEASVFDPRTGRRPFAVRSPEVGRVRLTMGDVVRVSPESTLVLVVDGRATDALGPGKHTLTTGALPHTTRLLRLPYGSQASFEAVKIEVTQATIENRGWGTRFPVAFHDNMFGVIRIRGYGHLSARVTNPVLFVNTVVRPSEQDDHAEPDGHLGDLVASRLGDFVSERVDTVIDLPRYAGDATNSIGLRLSRDLARRGVELLAFGVDGITVPEDVLAMLEARRGVGAVKQLLGFLHDQEARVVGLTPGDAPPEIDPEVLRRRGESDGEPMGLATDLGDPPAGSDEASLGRCNACAGLVPASAVFCPTCGEGFELRNPCLGCGQENAMEANYCLRCGTPMDTGCPCPACNAELPMGCRYCMACGNPTGNLEDPSAPAASAEG